MALPHKQEFLATHLKPLPQISSEECTECSICSEDMTTPVQLPCGGKHIYCQDCIDQWFKRSTSCPLCREVLFQAPRFVFMNYTLGRPPPPYDNLNTGEEGRSIRAESRLQQIYLSMIVEGETDEEEEAEYEHECDACLGGLISWISRIFGGSRGEVMD